MKPLIEFTKAFKRYWVLLVLAVISGIFMSYLPDWNFIPFGFLRAFCALLIALYLRHTFLVTIGDWIDKGGFKEAWEETSPEGKVKIAVYSSLVLFIGSVICFVA